MLRHFQRGVFTLSLDFELVWGSRDLRSDPSPLLEAARRTRDEVFGPLLDMLVERDMVATWATVGHLFLDGADRVDGALHPGVTPPSHAWRPDWFGDVPSGTEATQPAWYARSLVERLRDAGQEVGCHGFSHPIYGDPGCTPQAAASDLDAAVQAARALGIELRSFVFPRNSIGHLPMLAERGFTVWRGEEPTWYYREGAPARVRRLGHLADVLMARCPPTVMPMQDEHGLWCLPGSASFLPVNGVRRMIPISRRVRRAIRGLEQAVRDRRVCHLWLHPINLAADPRRTLPMIERVLDHAHVLRQKGALMVWPMARVVEQAARGSTAWS